MKFISAPGATILNPATAESTEPTLDALSIALRLEWKV